MWRIKPQLLMRLVLQLGMSEGFRDLLLLHVTKVPLQPCLKTNGYEANGADPDKLLPKDIREMSV